MIDWVLRKVLERRPLLMARLIADAEAARSALIDKIFSDVEARRQK